MDKSKYYIGLDCGTSSVGWAVTDENYNLLRRRGKTMWGMRLFDEAKTAAERRGNRSVRRRLARTRGRVKLLQRLFADEIVQVDPDFYIRLRESMFLLDDKRGLSSTSSKYILFDDQNYTDKDYYKQFPTIWHLRNDIVNSLNDNSKHFDIRHYYLAIEHILKHRGHFLREGEIKNGAGNFEELWQDFCDKAEVCGIEINRYCYESVEKLLKSKATKNDKKKQLVELALADVENGEYDGDCKLVLHVLLGSLVSLAKAFNIDADEDYKVEFAKGVFEDKLPEISDFVSPVDGAEDLIIAAKQIYDFIYLSDLLGGKDNISAAMVRNYEIHQAELKSIKEALKPYKQDYDNFFKTEIGDGIYYNAYIGKGSTVKNKAHSVNQEDLNKELEKLFEKNNITGELLEKAKERKLLPKQRGFAKGTIPQQLHHNELEIILQKLVADYPGFGYETDENLAYNTKVKKIALVHSFRIPYYCGPMKTRTSKDEFTWGEEIEEIVYPWNYAEKVNLGERAEKFINRMTNQCTYIPTADVLPKNSLLYQRYMVLNELNNLKINGRRIDNEIKQRIFNQGYYIDGELVGGNITLNKLQKWMRISGIIGQNDEVSGTSDQKTLPKLSTHADFYRILGEGYNKRYSETSLEQVVRLITILNNEREMLSQKIEATLGCTTEQATKLSKLNYKDWGRFSAEFLNGIRANVNGRDMSIIEALWETPNNLMELLGGGYSFSQVLDERNNKTEASEQTELTYEQVKELYCSPAVKRTVWQTIKIVKEIIKIMGYKPDKVFIEMTRGGEKGEKKVKLARRKDLIDKYRKITGSPEAKELLKELDGRDDRDLQQKKLYLYYQQMGRCAYCGERIDIEEINNINLYDIDHIYPRSKTKDDSITRNLVLVHANENREKTNTYPISDGIRTNMHGTWNMWYRSGLITKEKYERLTRATPLTSDELAGFIARQMVETSQSTKAICDLLRDRLGINVVTVKAGGVSELRRYYGYSSSDESKSTYPQFIKIRELNDIHHAKDAYLNVVVGNVINSTFTNNPYKWIKEKEDNAFNYSISTHRIFRESEQYVKKNDETTIYPTVKGWNFAETLRTVADTMARNDVSWTRMNHVLSTKGGGLMDAMLVRKDANYIPRKQDKRLADTSKYGGYNSAAGAYFALIQLANGSRKIIQIPLLNVNNVDKYIQTKYPGAIVVIPRIDFMSKMKINGFPVHLAGRTGDSLSFYAAFQITINEVLNNKLKKIINVVNKDLEQKGKYKISDKDCISVENNMDVFNELISKYIIMKKRPELLSTINKIITNEVKEKFLSLNLKDQCKVLHEMLKVLKCNPEKGNLSLIVDKASTVGGCRISNNINNLDSIKLIYQSPTGLYEREIDLKTVQPGEV